MSGLAILQPMPFRVVPALSSLGEGIANLASAEPREAFVVPGVAIRLVIDLGTTRTIDTIFAGFTDAVADAAWSVAVDPDFRELHLGTVAHSYRRAPLRHGLVVLPEPVATRYLRIEVAASALGVVTVGRAIRPEGHEWGGGRPIQDGTRVERLPGGGFGIAPGAVSGGWQWTMPGLSDELVERLYALALDVGIGGTILVVEDPDAGPALNERIHWGLLTRLEPFVRQQPGDTKWAMQVQDW